MYTGTMLDSQRPRNVPNGIASGTWIPKGAKITATMLQDTWLKLATVDGTPKSGWVNAGVNQSKIKFQVYTPPTDPPPVDPPPPTSSIGNFAVANMNWEKDWWTIPEYSKWANFPMSAKQCDNGNTTSRGRNIPVSNSLWDFMYKQNDAAGIKFIESVGRLIINRPYIDRHGNYHDVDAGQEQNDPANADPQALAEPIIFPVNVHKIIGETATHCQIDALYYGQDFSKLDPKVYNWENMPWLFPKCCAESRTRTIQNVMSGVDAFWITLCQKSGAWIPKELLIFPPDPGAYVINGKRGTGYKVRGANWYMTLEDGTAALVRSVTKTRGKVDYHGWQFNARSVVPPLWFS